MKLVFATNNAHKLEEIKKAIGSRIEILSLRDAGFEGSIPETGTTLKMNSHQKASYVHALTGMDCFADDTGLEIDALGGEPGVFSARFAGEDGNSEKNVALVLEKMKNHTQTSARFKTVITLILDEKEYYFTGVIEGNIIRERRGNSGFGYDPIFVPQGYDKTFAELPLDTKNEISHRGIASRKLAAFLKEYVKK